MAVPKRRKSKSRTNIRFHSNSKLTAPNPVPCPSCGEYTMPHSMCPHCGKYRERVIREIEET